MIIAPSPFRRAVGTACLGVLVVSLAGCGTGGSSPVVVPPSASTAGAAATAGSPVEPSETAAANVPISDAVAFRDAMLIVMAQTPMDVSASTSTNAGAIRDSWLAAYPDLKLGLFSPQPSDPTTVSADQSFVEMPASGAHDQALGFAVIDLLGQCAGGAAIIAGLDGGISLETVPATFVKVDPPVAKCSADGVRELYKPGS